MSCVLLTACIGRYNGIGMVHKTIPITASGH